MPKRVTERTAAKREPDNRKKMHTRLSAISTAHYAKLAFRTVLFLVGLIAYCTEGDVISSGVMGTGYPAVLVFIWLAYLVEIIARFFPSRFESMGCQKQFARNHMAPQGNVLPPSDLDRGVLGVTIAWCGVNLIFGALYLCHVFDAGMMLLFSLFYSVCDMICILFFCPFQTFLMKNRCCVTCRIYNWDFAMICTPFLFVKSAYTWSLLALSIVLLIRWEYTVHRYPQRFYEEENGALSCINCKEKLCNHKKQLQSFLKIWWSGTHSRHEN